MYRVVEMCIGIIRYDDLDDDNCAWPCPMRTARGVATKYVAYVSFVVPKSMRCALA